jgi:1-acyl-sn-glycerol-3-phosphate acyltransferase
LTHGSSVVTFAEGTRSPDGTLQKFKKGPFKMSAKAGVRIVPVSICGLHRWMPPTAILPLAFPFRAVEIVIHPPVETVRSINKKKRFLHSNETAQAQ